MPNIIIPSQAILFREHWKEYRRLLPVHLGGHSKKFHYSVKALWRLHGADIWNTYFDTIQSIAYADTCVTIRTLMRLREAKRQRWLEHHGYLPTSCPSRILPQLDDDQLSRFIDLAQSRLRRLLYPIFEPKFIHRLLYELGLFVYNGHDGSLSFEEVVLLGLSGTLCSQIGGSRREIRKEHGYPLHQFLPIYQPLRLRHPMIKYTIKDIIQRGWRYFQGGRIFLWISSVVYWRYWRDWRRSQLI